MALSPSKGQIRVTIILWHPFLIFRHAQDPELVEGLMAHGRLFSRYMFLFASNGPELSLAKVLSKGQSFIRVKLMPACFYILRLRSGTLYSGATKNLGERYKAHTAGRACRTTKLDPPVKVVYSESLPTFSDARKREEQIKRWSRAKKEALVAGDMVKLRNLSKSRNRKGF